MEDGQPKWTFRTIVRIRVGRTRTVIPTQQEGRILAAAGLLMNAAALVLSVYRPHGPEYVFLYGNLQFVPVGVIVGASLLLGMGVFAMTRGRTLITLPSGMVLAAVSMALYLFLTSGLRTFPPATYGNPLPGFLGLAGLAALEFVVITSAWKALLMGHRFNLPPGGS